MCDAVDHAPARAADALAAIRVEGDRILTLPNEVFVDDVEHLEERHVCRDVLRDVIDKASRLILCRLPPHAQIDCNSLR
jgi:hypothetical protein